MLFPCFVTVRRVTRGRDYSAPSDVAPGTAGVATPGPASEDGEPNVVIDVTEPAAEDRVGPPTAGVVATFVGHLDTREPQDEHSAELEKVAEATRLHRAVWAVPFLVAAMLATAIAIYLFAVPNGVPSSAPHHVEWWILAIGFLLGESMAIHLPVQRDSHTISMTEVPLVLGLAMASPFVLVVARLSAAMAVLLRRRQPLLKMTFNLTLFLLETVIAAAVYRAILGSGSPASPRGWLATTAAIGIAVTASAGLVDVVIALNDRRRRFAEIVRSFAIGSVISISVGVLGTVAVVALENDPRSSTLLIGATGLSFVLFKTYGALSRRHDDLNSLYAFTNQVDGTLGSRDIAVVTLREAVAILRAQHGEIILSDPTASHASYLGFAAGEEPAQRNLPVSEVADLFAIALGDKSHRMFGPETRDSMLRIALGGTATCGMIAPIAHGDGGIGVLVVAGRSGVSKRFNDAELELLDTLANHASLTLERARVIERLRGEIAAKQAAIRSKDQLIAAVSHELRTPLTGVLGFAEILHDSGEDLSGEEAATMLAAITDNAVDLTNIVEDLLTAARAQMGSLTIVPQAVALRPLVSRVVESTGKTAHHIVVSGASATVYADESRVRQILRNLISNAQRYGGHQIHIATHIAGDTVHVRVSDNGDGIPQNDQERIFSPYESAHDVGSQPGSLGLGLTISRSLARLMDGELSYERYDSWTTFDLELPLLVESNRETAEPAVELQQVQLQQL